MGEVPEQMQQAPMAMYGMEMGGYDMPFAAYGMAMGVNSNNYMGRTKHNLGSGPFLNRQMAEEGLIVGGMLGMPVIMSSGGYIDMYPDGGDTPRPTTNIRKVKKDEYDASQWETRRDAQGEYKYNKVTGQVSGRKEYSNKTAPKGTGTNPNLIADLCSSMKKKGAYSYGKTAEEVLAYAGFKPGTSLYDKHLVTLRACEQKGEVESEEAIYMEETPETPGCQCDDINKPNYSPYKDEQGNCTCEVEKCYCIDPATGKEVEKELTNGECICEEESGGGGYGAQAQSWEIPMQWTPQDERNLATAMRTRTGIEYPTAMTYQYPEVELAKEEWLSKVQGLQGQAAKNLDVLAGTAGSSTAKRAAAASLEGDVAEGIVNAIASTQARNVATENQERLTNYQGDVAEGQNRQNILNQYMDKVGAVENMYRGELNAKDALATQMINQGDTNAANIYNLQTEQYGIDPRTGKQIFKTGKPLTPEQEGQSEIEYAQALKKAGLEDDEREILLKARYSRFGGPVLQMGGMVYGDMVYPFYYYE
jgi:hypothetical protein